MTTVQSRPTTRREKFKLDEIADIATLVPWDTIDLPIRPYAGAWSMNPSVHFDGETWRCVIRCADYAMPEGVTIRGNRASPGYVINRNAMVILNPETLRTKQVFLMHEDDRQPRIQTCAAIGYEDMRLFQTADGHLWGIAASLHLDRRPEPVYRGPVMYRPRGSMRRSLRDTSNGPVNGRQQLGRAKVAHMAQPAPARARYNPRSNQSVSHPPEQVLVSFDEKYNIIDSIPIRGQWSGKPQKNWSPFDGADQPTFLYAIEDGKVFDMHGPLADDGADEVAQEKPPSVHKNNSGTEIRMMSRQPIQVQSGRGGRAGYRGLRGGTQLVQIGDRLDDAMGRPILGGGWVSLAHDMRHVNGKKFYWHTIYLVDSCGDLVGISEPFKLEPAHGIEFAAGLAVDGDRAVISYGVDDMICRLGVTSWEALLNLIVPIDALEDPTHEWHAREADAAREAFNESLELNVNGDGTLSEDDPSYAELVAAFVGDEDVGDPEVDQEEDVAAPAIRPPARPAATGWITTEDGKIPVEGVRR